MASSAAMSAPGEKLLKARDVADMLGLEMGTVLDRFEARDIPGFRLYGRKGGPVRFRLSEIEQWLEDQCRVGYAPEDNINGPAPRRRPGPVLKEVSP
jgi:predicted DNA-binding transcriptional regulator AlpA